RLPLMPFADSIAPTILLAQAIGRLGNWVDHELYGGPADGPLALGIYRRVDESGYLAPVTGRSTGDVIATVQPTFLYEMVWNLLIVCLLVYIDRTRRLGGGGLFMLYGAGYSLGCLFIEMHLIDLDTSLVGDSGYMQVESDVDVV